MAETEIKRVIKIESGQSANTLNNLSARIKELKSSMGDLDIASEEYRAVSEDINRLENTKRNAIRGVTAAVDGSYNAYSKELSILQKHRKTLKEGTDEYKEMTQRVAELQDKLKQMDAEVGTHTRNVGNYSSAFSGLQNSVNQVTRELPVLTMGADRFFLAISNNLPILYDNIKAYRAMAKEGNANVSVLGALGKALFSWNTVMTLGITILVQYGSEIISFVKKLLRLEKAVEDSEKRLTVAEQAVLDYSAALSEQYNNIGSLITRYKMLQAQWMELGDSMSKKEKFVRNNADAFKALGVEINNVIDAENLLIDTKDAFLEAMIARGKAMAAQNIATKIYEDILRFEVGVMENPNLNASFKAQFEEKEIRPLRQEWAKYVGKALEFTKEEQDIFDANGLKRPNTNPVNNKTDNRRKNTYNNRIDVSGAYKNNKLGIPALGTYAIDETAEIEANKARLEALMQMEGVSADERLAIEQRLADKLAMIEEIRLTEHEIILSNMLLDEELTADERIAIEQELTEVKIAQMENQLKAEEERAAKAKEIKDKELEEEKKRKEQMIAISTSMATATSNMLKNSAELLQEDSKERKALNAAAIVMDTYAAAMAGWKSAQSLMYPFNLVVGGTNVAASIAMGAAQLKNLYKVAEDGSNAMGSLSAPSVASSMPASYTRSLQGDNELTELNRDTRVYVVESDITNAQKSARVRVESASF